MYAVSRPRISRNGRLRTIASIAAPTRWPFAFERATCISASSGSSESCGRAAEGEAQQLAAELLEEGLAAGGEQVIPQPVEPLERRPRPGLGPGVDRPVAEVLVAAPADRVEAFEREAERVDPLVAVGALGVAGVLLDELADGQARRRRLVVGELRDALRRPGQALAQQDLADPVPPQGRAGPRGARLLGQGRRQAEHAAPAVLAGPRRPAAILGPPGAGGMP